MAIYNTIKNTVKGIKKTAIAGLVGLVLATTCTVTAPKKEEYKVPVQSNVIQNVVQAEQKSAEYEVPVQLNVQNILQSEQKSAEYEIPVQLNVQNVQAEQKSGFTYVFDENSKQVLTTLPENIASDETNTGNVIPSIINGQSDRQEIQPRVGRAYFCPRVGILKVNSQKNNTSPDYTGTYDTWGIEFGYKGIRLSYDALHADQHDNVNGTGVDVSLDTDVLGVSILGNKELGNSPFSVEYGANLSKVIQNVTREIGDPYNETDNSVESAYTIGPSIGIEVRGKSGYARLGFSYNFYLDSDCVESDSRITLSGGFMF